MQTVHSVADRVRDWIDVVDPTDDELDALVGRVPPRRPGLRRGPPARRPADACSASTTTSTSSRSPARSTRSTCTSGRTGSSPSATTTATAQQWDPAAGAGALQAARRPRRSPAGMLLATVLDDLIDGYFDTTDEMEDQLEALEDQHLRARPPSSTRAAAGHVRPPPRPAATAPRRRPVARGALVDPARRGRVHQRRRAVVAATTRSTSCCGPSISSTSNASCSATPSTPTSR